jgi:hypothetical protein
MTSELSAAMLIVFNVLEKDKGASAIIEKIDNAESDDSLKDGLRDAIAYLRETDQAAVADDVEGKLQGFI